MSTTHKYSKRDWFGRRRWFWRFTHTNLNIMANGTEAYNSKQARDDALETVLREMPTSDIVDLDTGDVKLGDPNKHKL